MNILEVENCKKSYGDKNILKGVSFDVKEGEVVSIIGPSGSGKTTLLKICTFLEFMDSGSLFYAGEKIVETKNNKAEYIGQNTLSKEALINNNSLKRIKQYFSLVFQNFNLFPHWTVLKNLIDAPITVQKRNKKEVEDKAMFYLEKMGLKDKMLSYPSELSGGQKQRVAIARALSMEPKIIFFDEPTSALDPELKIDVLHIIKELAKEKRTMVIVTHEMLFAKEVSDKIIFIDDGVIVEMGDAKQLFNEPKKERTKQFLKNYLQ